MGRRFEDVWSMAADDGANCPIGVSDGATLAGRGTRSDELGLLLEAWSCERSMRIEGSLLLEQAGRMIVKLLADEGHSSKSLRQARSLLRVIRDLDDR